MYSVYAIKNKVDEMVYIGATKRDLETRFREHIKSAHSGAKKKLSVHLRNVGINNFFIEKIDETNNKMEAFELETYYCSLNSGKLLNDTKDGKGTNHHSTIKWRDKIANSLKGRVPVMDKRTGKYYVVSKEEYESNEFLVGRTSGATTGLDLTTGDTRMVTSKERENNKAIVNPNEKIFYLYNNDVYRLLDIRKIKGQHDIRKILRSDNSIEKVGLDEYKKSILNKG